MRRLGILLLLSCVSLLLGESLYFFRKGFSPRRLANLHVDAKTKIDEETRAILNQPFYFLGRGRQCFAFVSQDDKYVLKCPRTDIFKIPLWLQLLPFPEMRQKWKTSRKQRQEFVFHSFRLASTVLQKETDTIAVHLGTSAADKQKLILVDSLGISHFFPLHTTQFVLQKKHQLWTPLFLEAVKQGNQEEQTRLLNAFVDVVMQRAHKHILNRDRSFLRNYGFNGEKAYQIDIGDFFNENVPCSETQIAYQSLDAVEEWLSQISPEQIPMLRARVEIFPTLSH